MTAPYIMCLLGKSLLLSNIFHWFIQHISCTHNREQKDKYECEAVGNQIVLLIFKHTKFFI